MAWRINGKWCRYIWLPLTTFRGIICLLWERIWNNWLWLFFVFGLPMYPSKKCLLHCKIASPCDEHYIVLQVWWQCLLHSCVSFNSKRSGCCLEVSDWCSFWVLAPVQPLPQVSSSLEPIQYWDIGTLHFLHDVQVHAQQLLPKYHWWLLTGCTSFPVVVCSAKVAYQSWHCRIHYLHVSNVTLCDLA